MTAGVCQRAPARGTHIEEPLLGALSPGGLFTRPSSARGVSPMRQPTNPIEHGENTGRLHRLRDTAQLGPSQGHPAMWAAQPTLAAGSDTDVPAAAASIPHAGPQTGPLAPPPLSRRFRTSPGDPAPLPR